MSSIATPEQVVQQLKWRYAVKKFDSTKLIPEDTWAALEDALILSPSSFGLQPWKFFVVKNPDLRQQLLANSWNQSQVVDASHLVVLAIKTSVDDAEVDRYIRSISDIRQAPLESLEGFGKVIKGFLANPALSHKDWAMRQVYIALSQLMVAAAMMEVDTCPMEGFNPVKYDEILGLTEKGYASAVVCPVGYRAADDKYAELAKVRYGKAEMVEYL